MALEEYQIFLYPFIDFFAVLAAIFALLLLFKIKKQKKKERLGIALSWVFGLIALGFVFNAIAELSWTFIEKVLGMSPELGLPDVFWTIGELLLFAGFTYFAIYMYKEHGKLKKGLVLLSAASVISASIIYYLISNFILGFQVGESIFEMFVDYFYPIISALILIAATAVYLFFRQLKDLGIPLLLLAIATFFAFMGDILYTYYSWNEIYGIPGVLSDAFFGINYMISAFAFYLLLKRWGGGNIREVIKSIYTSLSKHV